MVTGNHSYEEQTRRRLSEVRTESHALDEQIKELQEKSLRLTRQINAYETILEDYAHETQLNWGSLLQTMTHKEKLIAIAKEYGGRIGQSQATDIIYSNKLTGATKRTTVYQIVKNGLDALIDDGRLERVAPGKYQLIGTQPKLT